MIDEVRRRKRFSNYFLIFIFLSVAFTIIYNSYTTDHGFISPDSSNYLRLAQNLVDGAGFDVPSDGVYYQSLSNGDPYGAEKIHFTIWPVGYPILIYLLSAVSGLDVFFSSKIVNILTVGAILLLLKKIFKERAWLYSTILVTPSALQIFSYTWSEVPFLFGLLWFSYALYCATKNGSSSLSTFNLIGSSLFLFLMRYIGAFSIIVLSIVLLYKLLKKEDGYKKFLLVLVVVGVCISSYLLFNLVETGYTTGPRRSPYEDFWGLIRMTIIAGIGELNFFNLSPVSYRSSILQFIYFLVSSIIQLVFLIYLFSNIKPFKKKWFMNNKIALIFLLIGIVYLISIIIMRWTAHFDGLNYRLLFPSTLMVFLGCLSYADNCSENEDFRNKLYKSILILTTMLFLSPLGPTRSLVWYRVLGRASETSYIEHETKIKTILSGIPENSVIVFPDVIMRYLRRDVYIIEPTRLRDGGQSLNDFLNEVQNYSIPVYLYINERYFNSSSYNRDIIEFLKNHPEGTFIKLN